ncbi:uncharacterized protein [Zea mays]|uniref:uncharacterized protein n=1 Tax=Zea mays TaxID=4577 RepID=UPI000C6C87F4|nr:uncharacterized protein LOC103652144 [Zea mays]|eukprot:XP_023157861.1 uncharacterized protein LOC103652144 [Zea mays]
MAFRGHDESSTSLNRRNFLEMIDWYKDKNEIVRKAFSRGAMNCKMTSPNIQKDIARCCADVIMGDIKDRNFSILIDESRDISVKEQMAVMLRYVDVKGKVVERLLTLHHVVDTTSEALKKRYKYSSCYGANRFGESTIEILTCFSCLDPKNNFSRFDIDSLVRGAQIYDADFSTSDFAQIRQQLQTYILQVRRHAAFSTCTDIASLASKMVETEKHKVFRLVYRLIELALILPVSTASVERAFSAMKIIKTNLRNKMADEWFNHLVVCYIEREIFKELDDSTILRRFQGMKTRKLNLPRSLPS